MFIDFNAYFASVEQQEHPNLRNQPVAVAAVMTDTTCCIAASYEAKRMGVKTGTLIGQAKLICPGIRIVKARPQKYVQYHHRLLRAIESCLPIGSVQSIDEAWCPLSDLEREPPAAIALAKRVKQAIVDQVGPCLRCSIGLAPNAFLGKIASDMQKPDGLVVLTPNDLPHKLYPLELMDLSGIGPRMLKRLNGQNIFTVQQLCALPKDQLRAVWGSVIGEHWWHWLRGETTYRRPTHRSSLGHSHVLPPQFRTVAGAKQVLIRLIHRAARRLRQEGYWAKRMEVYISFSQREEGWRGEVALGLCQDTLTMIQALEQLWCCPPPGRHPTQVAVTLFGLIANAYAMQPLFPEEQSRMQLARAMDLVNDRFGHNTLYFAGMGNAIDAAPTRISFNQIPDEDDEDYEGVEMDSLSRAGLDLPSLSATRNGRARSALHLVHGRPARATVVAQSP